jgi:hypothetical protein
MTRTGTASRGTRDGSRETAAAYRKLGDTAIDLSESAGVFTSVQLGERPI